MTEESKEGLTIQGASGIAVPQVPRDRAPGQLPGEVVQGRDGGLREKDELLKESDVDELLAELGPEDDE